MLVVRARPQITLRTASCPIFLCRVRSVMISSSAVSNSGGKKKGFPKQSEDSKSSMTTMPTAHASSPIISTTPQDKNKTTPSPSAWTPLNLPRDELTLDYTLPTGQSFRWRRTGSVKNRNGEEETLFTGVVGKRVVQLSHVGESGQAAFRVLVDKTEPQASSSSSPSDVLEELSDYFNARVALAPMAARWAAADARWRSAARVARGARVLRQPPLECLLSFVCSSNNSIPRITGMVEHLARRYGTELASAEEAARLLSLEDDDDDDDGDVKVKKEKLDDDNDNAPATPSSSSHPSPSPSPSSALSRSGAPPKPDAPFYAFPTLDQLVGGNVNEADLREAGFGYRARYIVGTVEALASLREERRRRTTKKDGGEDDDFLLSLRLEPQERALEELAKLPGVGPKVAACVALFSLDKHAVVPVDTHVWQLAARHYLPSIPGKTFSPAAGHLVSTALAERFGPFAGWAHNALFIAELPGVRDEVARMEREERRKKRKGGDDVDESDDSDGSDDESESGSDFDEEQKPKAAAQKKKKRTTMAARRAEESAAVLSEMIASSKPGTPSKEV